jgi:hypothetical protein
MPNSSKKSSKTPEKKLFTINSKTKNIRGNHNDFFKNSDGTPSGDLYRGILNGEYIVSASKYDPINKRWSIACKSKKINTKHIIPEKGTEEYIVKKFAKEFEKKNQPKGAYYSYRGINCATLVPKPGYEEKFRNDAKWTSESSPFNN